MEHSHWSITIQPMETGENSCQLIKVANQVRAGRPPAIGGCYRGMLFCCERELWNSVHDLHSIQVEGSGPQ